MVNFEPKRVHKMSDDIVNIMNALRYNDRLVNLLIIDNNNIAFTNENRPEGFINESNVEIKNLQIVDQNSAFCRVSPTPFNPEAEEEDKSMIRVYYNQGEFKSEIIAEYSLFIDIIVAKSLWLIYDQSYGKHIIRPYEIMDCIIDTIGKRNGNPLVSVNFTGYQHLAVNTKFDAIRLYSESFDPDLYDKSLAKS